MNDNYDQLLLNMITDNEQLQQQFLGVSSAKTIVIWGHPWPTILGYNVVISYNIVLT